MMGVAQFRDMLLHDLLYFVLQGDIERGVDLHPGTRQLLAGQMKLLLELLQDEIEKMGSAVIQCDGLKEVGALRLLNCVERLHPCDVALLDHCLKDDLETL